MKDISFLAFEVKLSLLRQSLTDEGGIFRKPKPPNVEELQEGFKAIWQPIDDVLVSLFGDTSTTFLRYFYGASMPEDEEAEVANSFLYFSLLSPDSSSNIRLIPFDDREEQFAAKQINQIISKQEQSEDYECGLLYAVNMEREGIEGVFKEVWLKFSEEQNGELHLINFASNGLLNISLGNLPNGALSGSLAGETDGRISLSTLDASALEGFLTTLGIGPADEGLKSDIFDALSCKATTAKKTVKLTFKNVGGEFQYHRLNKEDSEYLKNEWLSDKDSFLAINLQGGESFEETIWAGSYGPSMNDIEIINNDDNKKINLDKVNKNQIFYTDGQDDLRSKCLDYFYITEGKIFGSYAINLSDGENFDPEKLTINYIEYSLDGYQEKFGAVIHEVEYDGATCDMEIEDNGVEIYRSIIGYELSENSLDDYIVIYDSDHQTTWRWDVFDKVFS